MLSVVEPMAALFSRTLRWAVAVAMTQLLLPTEAKFQRGLVKLTGTVDSADNWQFVSKFGYSIGVGDYKVRYRLPEWTQGNLEMRPLFSSAGFALILDEDWQKVQSMSSCNSKNLETRRMHEVPFWEPGMWSSWERGTVSQNIRPHIWYFGISKCNKDLTTIPLYLEYELHMTQGNGSEFSIEMCGMMALNFLVLICLVGFAVRYCERCRAFSSSAGKLHEVIWVLSAAIALQFAAQSLHTLHLWSYTSNGVGILVLDLMSEVLFMLSQVIFTTLLIAIAMGYTLLPSRTSRMAVVKLIAFMSLVVHTALVSFSKMQEESSSKYHENEGAIGWVLLSVRLMLLIWFLFATQASEQESGLRLRSFLQKFRIIGSIYFLAYPTLFVVVQIFAAYLQHPIMQIGLIAMQTISNVCLAELFLSRGTYFKVSALGCSCLPGVGAFDKAS